MPDRYVREALLGSPAWQSLREAETRLFFVRLILLADDFGVYDGRPLVIMTHAFPNALIRQEELDEGERMLHELHRAGLIVRYTNRGKPYIGIPQWGNDLRGSRRFPAPPVDLDLETLKPRGKFGKAIGWSNPPGCDPVSVLLDFDGQPVVPQPPEWRPPEHLQPDPKSKVGWRRKKGEEGQAQAAQDKQRDTGSVLLLRETGMPDASLQTPDARGQTPEPPPPPPPASQSSSSSSVPHDLAHELPVTHGNGSGNGDGRIGFDPQAGRFSGLTDALQAHWQSMFDFPIPEQIERAGAWLRANRGEADAINRDGRGYEPFLVRWLLREARQRTGTHGS